jgi:hypothetical protein
MGIHICLRNAAGKDHPDWDWIRHAGDRDFPHWTKDLPRVEGEPKGWTEDAFRPLDFPRWRAALPEDRINPDRFPHLLNLLEADEQWWVYYSY